jgi:hypothetical protein
MMARLRRRSISICGALKCVDDDDDDEDDDAEEDNSEDGSDAVLRHTMVGSRREIDDAAAGRRYIRRLSLWVKANAGVNAVMAQQPIAARINGVVRVAGAIAVAVAVVGAMVSNRVQGEMIFCGGSGQLWQP